MITSNRLIIWIAALLFPFELPAQSVSHYSLNEGKISFQAPADWPMIVQKNEGNPQFIALQVKDPADTNTGESTRISITTKLLDTNLPFQEFLDTAINKAKQTPGYTQDTDNKDGTSLRYTGMNGKTRYRYKDTFYQNGTIAIHVRCMRPQLAGTSKAWSDAYEKGCDQIIASLKPH